MDNWIYFLLLVTWRRVMEGDHTKFFARQQYVINSKFGSYLQSTPDLCFVFQAT